MLVFAATNCGTTQEFCLILLNPLTSTRSNHARKTYPTGRKTAADFSMKGKKFSRERKNAPHQK